MKFIEISPTVCVNVDQVAWVAVSEDGFGSTVYVGEKEYPCDMPYQTIVTLLQQSDGTKTMEKLDKYLNVATVTSL